MLDLWNQFPQDVQAFIISTAAGITTNLLPSGKKKDDIKEPLQVAIRTGITGFIKCFYEKQIEVYSIRKILQSAELKSLFIELVKDESLAGKTKFKREVKNAIEVSGVEVSKIKGFKLHTALTAFINGFKSKAKYSSKLLTYLNHEIFKQNSEALKSIDKNFKKVTKSIEKPKPNLPALKKKYFHFLKEKYSQMSFKGLSEGKLISFPLGKIYTKLAFDREIPPDTKKYLKKKEEMDKLEFIREGKGKEELLLSNVLDSQYAVITGDPGAGKSTLMKYIALAYVDKQVKERIGSKGDLLPIIFPVAAYAEARKKNGSVGYSLTRFIPEYFQGKNLPDLSPLFSKALKQGKALVLIDGLDEVADETERKNMVDDIRSYIVDGKYAKNKFIITCRTASYTKSARFEPVNNREFTHFSVLPFDLKHIEAFLFNWYCCYQKDIYKRVKTFEAEANKDLKKMMAVIKTDKNIHLIATNPLMLTILALIQHEGGELPRNRADLYTKCLRMLAGSWENLRSMHEAEMPEFKLGDRKITEDFIVAFLGPIAFEMHKESSPDIDYDELKDSLAKRLDIRNKDIVYSKEQAADFIKIMKERSGILQEASPGVYGFMHLTFKEYLASRVLTDLSDGRLADLGDNLFAPEWREVVLLTASSLKKRDASEFIKAIFKKNVDHYKNVILAGECAIDSDRDRIDDDLYDDIIKAMIGVVESDSAIHDKVALGETLGWLGDTRDLQIFKKIEGGKYFLKELDKEVMIEPFEIGQYPVTNGWYEKFISDGGYQKEEFWSEEGQKWLKHAKQDQPRYWDERKWRCPNSPVVGVTWYEADAFTKWLAAHGDDKYNYRLPTEEEWQAAAAGFEGRDYPWGDWEDNVCNTREVKIEKTSPVGIFVKGRTLDTEVYDLSGNVWEWTKTNYYTGNPQDMFPFYEDWKLYGKNKQRAAIRGGSWDFNQDNARCANRFGNVPDSGDFTVGFRCARTLKS